MTSSVWKKRSQDNLILFKFCFIYGILMGFFLGGGQVYKVHCMIYLSLKHSITNKFYVEIQLILHALENYNPPPLSMPITAFLAQKCCRSFLWAHTIWYTLKKRIEKKLICNYFCFQIMHDNREIGSYHPTTILGSMQQSFALVKEVSNSLLPPCTKIWSQ